MTDQQETTPQIEVSQNEVSTSQAVDTLIKQFDVKLKEMKTIVSELRGIKKEVTTLEKQLEKQRSKKKKNKNSSGNPSGFAIARPISDELSEFLGLEKGVPIARTDVTKLLTKYIADHDLKKPENKRNILLTGEHGLKFKNILSDLVDKEGNPVELSYFNLQRYIKHHFPNSAATLAAEAAEDVSSDDPVKTKKKIVKKVIKKPVVVEA